MRDSANRIQMLSTLRFVLNVMEERSHLGLDDKTAESVRSALFHQILATERAVHFPPSAHTMKGQSAEEFLIA
jgi:hypothetical protein